MSQRIKEDKGYHKLLVWKKAKDLVTFIYKETENFPRAEEFGLKGQLRRASVSVVLNIVEGHRRQSTKEFIRFVDIAQASLVEVEAILEICLDLDYFSDEKFIAIENKRAELDFLLGSLMKSLRRI